MDPRSSRALRAGVFLLAALWLVEARPSPTPCVAPLRPAGEGVSRLLWGGRLDPNAAPEAALRALPGIGPRRAAAIVAGRPYCRASEVRGVRGIGPVTWNGIRASFEVRDRPMGCEVEADESSHDG